MAPTYREGVPKAALSTNCPREPAGQPHSHGVPWAFQQTLQTSGKLRVPGALLDGFPILPPQPLFIVPGAWLWDRTEGVPGCR